MVETIFENKVVQINDKDCMWFPIDFENHRLLPDCSKGGQRLSVKYEKGTRRTLTFEREGEKMRFTAGWKEFREARSIEAGDKISFYKQDDSFGDHRAPYKIIVKKEN